MTKIFWTAKEYVSVFKRMQQHMTTNTHFPNANSKSGYAAFMKDLPAKRRRPVNGSFVNTLIDAYNLWRVNSDVHHWAPSKALLKEPDPRTIRTVFYADMRATKVLKINRAKYANNAVLHCVNHMQLDSYSARLAEVFDDFTGEAHAVVERTLKGGIVIIFKRDVKENY